MKFWHVTRLPSLLVDGIRLRAPGGVLKNSTGCAPEQSNFLLAIGLINESVWQVINIWVPVGSLAPVHITDFWPNSRALLKSANYIVLTSAVDHFIELR